MVLAVLSSRMSAGGCSLGTEKTLDSTARLARNWIMVLHPITGQNLLMVGADLLDTPTGTAVVQRSEGGQGILGPKEGKGMWVWSTMVLAVLLFIMNRESEKR